MRRIGTKLKSFELSLPTFEFTPPAERAPTQSTSSVSSPNALILSDFILSPVITSPIFAPLAPISPVLPIGPILDFVFSGARAREEAARAGQWHIANPTAGLLDLNIGNVWDDYTGRGVRIGVYDTGIQSTHSDLNDNYNSSLEFAGDNPGPDINAMGVRSNDAHGTAVAGIIAAEQNGQGVVGIAYGATVTSVDTVGASTVSNWNDFIAGMSRFDVVNRSSGVSRQFQNELADDAAYRTAVQQGRNGRGTIVVESAGNDRQFGDLNSNGTTESTDALRGDANADGANSGHYTIVVGSVDQTGRVDTYSSPGANLLVSAFGTPSQVVTTDLVGTDGYNGNTSEAGGDITGGFSGTSAATPMVSGIVALMLEANTNLGWRDVQNILALTARHVGSDMGAAPTGPERFRWSYNQADNWNGGGMHFSNDYGYGLVDARAAVRLAESWTLQSTSLNERTATAMQSFTTPVNITEMNTVPNQFTLRINDAISTESISVFLEMNHSRMSDLRIEVRSPEGTWSTLTDRTGLGGADFGVTTGWTFTSNAFRGERAQGDWLVRVWDMADSGGAADNGTISTVVLRTFGSSETLNDQLYYTDEYGAVWAEAVAQGNYGRLQITDTDGGTDTINAAAVSVDSSINLEQGGISRIGNGYAQVAIGTVIENAFGGDGNDMIYGNATGNLLRGNRGDDYIDGRGGTDSLLGDRGNDTLVGGAMGDVINGGAGIDAASYHTSIGGVVVSLGDQREGVWNGIARGGDAAGDVLYGIENLTGSMYVDELTGNAGDNVIDGGGNADFMSGREGNDTYVVDNVDDVVNEEIFRRGSFVMYADAGSTRDHVMTSLSSYDLSASGTQNFRSILFPSQAKIFGTIEDLTYTGRGNFTGIGNASDNRMTGGVGDDNLFGLAGNDTLRGAAGRDRLDLGSGDNTAYADNGTAAGGDIILGSEGRFDTVFADTAATTGLKLDLYDASTGLTEEMTGKAFTAVGVGVESVIGGSGNDVFDASAMTTAITLAGGEGNDALFGGSGDDVMDGGVDDDTLTGGLGRDALWLGNGDNIAWIDNGTAAGGDVVEGGRRGLDRVFADASTIANGLRLVLWTLGAAWTADVVSVAFTSSGIGIEEVHGNDGSDWVDATRLGDDGFARFFGGLGDDTLASSGGYDNFDGGEGFDVLVCTGLASNYTFGHLTTEDGQLVTTILDALTGTTDYIYDVERVVFSWEGVETIVDLGGVLSTITGDDGDNELVGDAGANRIEGLGGDDLLIGVGGADELVGGEGIDTANYAASAAAVQVSLVTGTGSGGDAEGDTLIGIEGLVGSAFDDVLISGPDRGGLDGGDGNDTLVGGAAYDDVAGGAGNDVIQGTTGYLSAYGGTGDDVMTGSVDNYNFLEGGDGNDLIIGGQLTDYLADVDGGDDTMYGGDGDDTMVDYAGTARMFGEGGNDFMTSSAATSLLDGGDGDDTLFATAGGNTLHGGDGNDVLAVQGGGYNIMTGGTGADVYDFRLGSLEASQYVVTDFELGVDKLSFSDIVQYGNYTLDDLTIADGADGVVISYGADQMTLLGITADQLRSVDFVHVV